MGHEDEKGTNRFWWTIRLTSLAYPNTFIESEISMTKIELRCMILLKYIVLRIGFLSWCSFNNKTSDRRYTLLTNVFYSAKWVYLTKCNLSRYNMYPVVYNWVHTYAPGRNVRVHMCTKSYTTEYTCVPYRVRQNTHVYEEVDNAPRCIRWGIYMHARQGTHVSNLIVGTHPQPL